jgi:hypothetical protein
MPYVVIENIGPKVDGVWIRATFDEALKHAIDLGEENGIPEQEIVQAMYKDGFHEQGDYRLTVMEAH